ncbi:hypothetical protein DFH06DRAFT_1137521 [Mycena polygramma]|nr:hypothetical protein DFH06DRAFT_1137521 [Mycena polygramma]
MWVRSNAAKPAYNCTQEKLFLPAKRQVNILTEVCWRTCSVYVLLVLLQPFPPDRLNDCVMQRKDKQTVGRLLSRKARTLPPQTHCGQKELFEQFACLEREGQYQCTGEALYNATTARKNVTMSPKNATTRQQRNVGAKTHNADQIRMLRALDRSSEWEIIFIAAIPPPQHPIHHTPENFELQGRAHRRRQCLINNAKTRENAGTRQSKCQIADEGLRRSKSSAKKK